MKYVFGLLLLAAGCSETRSARGRAALHEYGCVSCHVIPGVPNAAGHVGPALTNIKYQSFIAGVLRNDRANLVRFIRFPRDVDPETAMPNLDVSQRDAVAMADYLEALQ